MSIHDMISNVENLSMSQEKNVINKKLMKQSNKDIHQCQS